MKLRNIFSLALCAAAFLSVSAQNNWMADLPDDAKVRELSIPGSHDAATSSLSGGSFGGKAQSYTIADQWEKGVRVFDLRPREDMKIYHTYDTGVTMDNVFTTLQQKLEANPTEIAIMVIRLERDNPTATQNSTFNTNMKSLVEKYDDLIVEFSPSLKVKNARGKIIILSRNEFESDKAAMLYDWAHWPTLGEQKDHFVTLKLGRARGKMYLQDKFEYDNGDIKKDAVSGLLNWAAENTYEPIWIINHASGYKPSLLGTGATTQFETNAKLINPFIIENMPSKGRVGIIMMDFAGDGDGSGYYGKSLVDAVIAQNWTYLTKKSTE